MICNEGFILHIQYLPFKVQETGQICQKHSSFSMLIFLLNQSMKMTGDTLSKEGLSIFIYFDKIQMYKHRSAPNLFIY